MKKKKKDFYWENHTYSFLIHILFRIVLLHVNNHRCSCNLCIARNKELQLIRQKPYSTQPQMPYSTWRKFTWMNRNWATKLQVTLLFTCISSKKLCSHTFKTSSEEVIAMHSEKMKTKYIKEDVWKRFFLYTCRLGSRNFITN